MSMPVTTSVTVCSTWMRGLTSMKKNSPRVGVDQELDRAGALVAGLARQAHGRVADARRAPPGRGAATGAISTTFWWRRWTEQSRSNRCTTLPCWSPRICTSMCQARSTRRSRKTSSLPNAARASRRPASTASSSVGRVVDHAHAAPAAAPAGLDHQREADLLGQPPRLGRVVRQGAGGRHHRHAGALGQSRAPRPCRPGAPAPRRGGPIQVMPSRTQASASSGFSARKP